LKIPGQQLQSAVNERKKKKMERDRCRCANSTWGKSQIKDVIFLTDKICIIFA